MSGPKMEAQKMCLKMSGPKMEAQKNVLKNEWSQNGSAKNVFKKIVASKMEMPKMCLNVPK